MNPVKIASFALHRRWGAISFWHGSYSPLLRCMSTAAIKEGKLKRTANSARKMAANAIKKMHVLAY
jgi:hypothetical protein